MAVNVLFDSSFILHRNIFSLANNSGKRFLDSDQDVSLFVKKTIDDINSIVSIFPKNMLGKLIWAKDSRSWRKDLIEGVAYKGTRVKDETKVNWDVFRRVTNEFAEVLPECGIIVSSEETAEADDLLYLWSQHFLESEESSVIVTSDRDLNQCIRHENGNIVCTYNPMFNTKRFTFHESLMGYDWSTSSSPIDDLFSAGQESSAERLFKISIQYEQEFINPYKVSIDKIFEGDKSDNVPSALQWKKVDSTGKEKTFSFTPRMMNILMKGMRYDNTFLDKIRFDSDFRRVIAMEAVGISGQPLDSNDVSQAILNNISLMYLDRSVIPSNIQISNLNESRTQFDLRDTKVYEIRPEWTYAPSEDGSMDSDIFSMMM